MEKFWYFSAMLVFGKYVAYYSGYVTSSDLFPINVAETQTKDYTKIREREDVVYIRSSANVIILNQVEVDGARYDIWKTKMGFK